MLADGLIEHRYGTANYSQQNYTLACTYYQSGELTTGYSCKGRNLRNDRAESLHEILAEGEQVEDDKKPDARRKQAGRQYCVMNG